MAEFDYRLSNADEPAVRANLIETEKKAIQVESDRLDIAIANLRDAINVLVLEISPCLNTSGTVEEHDIAMPEPIGCSLHYRRLYEFTNQINYLRETVRTATNSVEI